MDELARRYILLCLRLERVAPGVVDSYVGPRDLAEVVSAEEPKSPTELHDEALALRELAAELPAEGTDGHRRRWFDGQLRSFAMVARRADGEEIGYLDFVEGLFGVPIAPTPEAELTAAREELDAALPGRGTVAERTEMHRSALRVPSGRILPALVASANRYGDLARTRFAIPDPEGIDWAEAHDQPWGAYAVFTGNGRTSITVNVDLPLDVTGIAFLASHEAYPGHHAEHVTKERTLARRGESTMRTMGTPEAMLAEGLADVAGEIVMDDADLGAELAQIGADVGVSGDWQAAVALYRTTLDLNPAMSNAAYMIHHLGRSETEVREWLDATVPRPDWLDHLMRAVTDPSGRYHVFSYTEGARLIRRWLERAGRTAGFARLLSEQLSPDQLLAELGEGR